MNCPSCKNTVLVMTERSGIEIDYCPSCRGVWLDRGELDKIIEKSQDLIASPQSSSPRVRLEKVIYKDNNHSEDGEKYKRKKSFFEEIFD